MTQLLDPEKGGGKLTDHLNGAPKKVLIIFFHGVGDVVMFLAPLQELRRRYPHIQFDLGLCRGLDEEKVVPDAVLVDGDWREQTLNMGYDIVFPVHFPLEKLENTTQTKAEVSCISELGIDPISGHLPLTSKRLVAVHFQMTSVPWVANADSETAKRIWDDVSGAGFVPFESHFCHVFHNPANAQFDWLKSENHVRNWPARLDTLMALLGTSAAFVGVVSGNFHLALSILGPKRVMLLEKDLKASHFTKEKIATADLKNYSGEVKTWLESLEK